MYSWLTVGVIIRLVHTEILHISAGFSLYPAGFMHLLADYLTDELGSLGSLLNVGTVDYRSVVEVGFGVLLVGNLRGRKAEH